MEILLYGLADKRFIAYPLLKVVKELGKVLVVSDDGCFRRFSDEGVLEFSLGNIDFMVSANYESISQEVSSIKHQYNYIVYVLSNEIPQGVTKVIQVKGVSKHFYDLENENTFHVDNKELDIVDVVVSFNKLKDKEVLTIIPSKSLIEYVYNCEDSRDFLATKDSSYASMLQVFFEKELGFNKNQLKSLLAKG